MADASQNFSKLVPGFDFLQGLVKNAGQALPALPKMGLPPNTIGGAEAVPAWKSASSMPLPALSWMELPRPEFQ